MADEKGVGSAISSKCSVCGEEFENIQECLKHELINHSLQKKSGPNNHIQKRINAGVKFLNSDDKKLERKRLNQQLENCRNGDELQKIFELFCMKMENLGLVYTRIQTCLEKELQSAGIAGIYPFGSIANGLALRDCDIDIYLDVSSMNATPHHKKRKQNKNDRSHLTKPYNLINRLLHSSEHFIDVYAIRKARVPIIKCQHKDTGFNIDINISYPASRKNTQFIHDLVKSDTRIRELMLFVKLWAKNTQIVGKGAMTSYCLAIMVIFFLQQPRQTVNAAGKNDKADGRILKSIKEGQANCPFHMVQGVNYAYDLKSEENRPLIPKSVTSWDLIKEFFSFYENFDFENHVISPYYGKSIAKTDFLTPDKCAEYYNQLKTITQYLEGEPAYNLKIDCCMCVQDIFCLNQNAAKNIMPQNKQYILFCLRNAKRICQNAQNLTPAQLYTQLLFESVNINSAEKKVNIKTQLTTILKKSKALPVVADTTNMSSNNDNFSYKIIPSKADLRAITNHYPEIIKGSEILQCWCEHYINAISMIMTEFFHMDMCKQLPAKRKQQKLDTEETENNLNSSWAISCTIDLWSNRCFQKNLQTTYMTYQLQQTERLHNFRRQDPKFSVTLNGILKLKTMPDNMGVEIKFELPADTNVESLGKKSPMRKFFNVFKNTLQSFSFKEILNIGKTSAKTNETEKTTDTGIVVAVSADNS